MGRRIRLGIVALCLCGVVSMSLAVSSVMSQAHGWVNNNLGWVTVGAAAATVAVTLSYVYWTWRLVNQNRTSLQRAQDANALAKGQYMLALQNRQDAVMPAVVVRFTGTHVEEGRPNSQRLVVPLVQKLQFTDMPLVIRSSFYAKNFGPGPALIWAAAESPYTVRCRWKDIDPSRDPVVLGPNEEGNISVEVFTDGGTVLTSVSGNEHARVLFKWSGLVDPETHDESHFSLQATNESLNSEQVGSQFLSRLFAQPSCSRLPSIRHYPGERFLSAAEGHGQA